MMLITCERLKELLNYDPESGLFTRLTSNYRWKAGCVVGSFDRSKSSTAGYVKVFVDGKRYKAHRLAWLYMTGEWPEDIDHTNHVRHDNRWCNLRSVDQSENTKNRTMNKNNTSGFRGVHWYKPSGKWMAYINTSPGKRKNLGYFDSLIDAVATRLRGESQYRYHCNHGMGQ
jgi:hypothetical protein